MNTYRIFEHDEKVTSVVKDGFSWPGLLFFDFWALRYDMFLISMPLSFIHIAIFRACNVLSEAGNDATETKLLVVLFLLHVVVGVNANKWRIVWLVKQEYTYARSIVALSVKEARKANYTELNRKD